MDTLIAKLVAERQKQPSSRRTLHGALLLGLKMEIDRFLEDQAARADRIYPNGKTGSGTSIVL